MTNVDNFMSMLIETIEQISIIDGNTEGQFDAQLCRGKIASEIFRVLLFLLLAAELGTFTFKVTHMGWDQQNEIAKLHSTSHKRLVNQFSMLIECSFRCRRKKNGWSRVHNATKIAIEPNPYTANFVFMCSKFIMTFFCDQFIFTILVDNYR